MYVYLSADCPVAVLVNGKFLGKAHKESLHLPLTFSGENFVQVCPLTANRRGVNFLLCEEFLLSPPMSVAITCLGGGYHLLIKPPVCTGEFKMILSQKFSRAQVTVFAENGYKLSVETPTDFFAEGLDFEFDGVECFNLYNGRLLLVAFKTDQIVLYPYLLEDKIKKLAPIFADEFNCDPDLTTTLNQKDIARRQVTKSWGLIGGELICKNKSVKNSAPPNLKDLNPSLLPFILAEGILNGESVEEYLHPDIKENHQKLKGYLGDFIGVIPPPEFKDIVGAGLVYKKSENLYVVKYLTCELVDDKIFNLHLEE